jgi:hypothetical protein
MTESKTKIPQLISRSLKAKICAKFAFVQLRIKEKEDCFLAEKANSSLRCCGYNLNKKIAGKPGAFFAIVPLHLAVYEYVTTSILHLMMASSSAVGVAGAN